MSEILPVAGAALPVPPLLPVTGADASAQRELTRSVAQAVSQLNESGYAGEGREVLFSVDRSTRLPVVKVVDTTTKEVISQWPPEYAIRLAESQAANKTGDS
jgi:flagellar protein FlaG